MAFMRASSSHFFKHFSFVPLLILLIIFLGGTVLRFWRLDNCALYMDSQDFLAPFDLQLKTHEVFTRWLEMPTGKNHLPLPVYLNTMLLRTFNLPPTIGNLALPAAAVGSILILIAYLIGKTARDDWTGLFCAMLTAFNPVLIAISRTPYYYIFALLGAFLNAWAWVMLLRAQSPFPSRLFYIVLLFGDFFMFYADSSVWAHAFASTLFAFVFLTIKSKNETAARRDLFAFCGITIAAGLPLIFIPWGLPTILKETFFYSDQARQYWTAVFYSADNNVFAVAGAALKISLSFLWGTTFLRCLAAIPAVLCLAYYALKKRHSPLCRWLALVFCLSLILQILAISKTVVPPTHARFIYLVPLFYMFCALAFREAVAWLEVKKPPYATLAGLAVVAAIGSVYFYPAFLAASQTGRPQPYFAIAKWLDSHLPQGSLAITERFFDAFNEYRRHPATNVFITSTVRNQTAPEYLGNHFRERTQNLMLRNPVSALLQTEILWDHPEIGPWRWPESFYTRHIVITNEAGLKLHRLGLADASLPWDKTAEKRYQRKILYNLPEDIIARAKQKGAAAVLLKSAGWGYVKTQDYQDWSVLFDKAVADIHLFTDTPSNVTIKMTGIVPTETKAQKTLVINKEHMFKLAPNKWLVLETPPISISPGVNHIVFQDTAPSVPTQPFLVQEIQLSSGSASNNLPAYFLP